MKTAALTHILLSGVFLFSFVACNKQGNEEPASIESSKAKFSIEVEAIDGELMDGAFAVAPSVKFTLSSEDPYENYLVEYSVDGGESKTLDKFWDGRSRTIVKDFSGFNSYGVHTISGYAHPVDDESLRESFESKLWVKYVPITVSSISFITSDGVVDFEGASLYSGTSGILQLNYEPSGSSAEFKVVSLNPEVISFDSDRMGTSSGIFSIPFSVTDGKGAADVVIQIKNGEDIKETRTLVTVSEAAPVQVLDIALNASSFVLVENPLLATTVLLNGDQDIAYDMVYIIDGSKVASFESIKFSEKSHSLELSIADLNMGKHTLSVSVSASALPSLSANASKDFEIVAPYLRITDSEGNTTDFSEGDMVEFELGKEYAFAFPENSSALSDFLIFESLNPDDVITYSGSGKSSGTIVPASRGLQELRWRITGSDGYIAYPCTRFAYVDIHVSAPTYQHGQNDIRTGVGAIISINPDYTDFDTNRFAFNVSAYGSWAVLVILPSEERTVYEENCQGADVLRAVEEKTLASTVYSTVVDITDEAEMVLSIISDYPRKSITFNNLTVNVDIKENGISSDEKETIRYKFHCTKNICNTDNKNAIFIDD